VSRGIHVKVRRFFAVEMAPQFHEAEPSSNPSLVLE
jgi:hypothetical protein